MKKRKLYLETSVWSFYHADDAPDKRDVTRRFFEDLADSDIHVAEPVYTEVRAARAEKRDLILAVLERFKPTKLSTSAAVDALAELYLTAGALPPGSDFDALHVAYATVHDMTAIVSWNMRHIANLRTQEKVNAVNSVNGYDRLIQLLTPLALVTP